jgi:hypothetical protein
VQWLIMRGALPAGAVPHIEAYYPHKIMGYAVQAYEAADAKRESGA